MTSPSTRLAPRAALLKPTAINTVLAEVRELQAAGRSVVSLMRGEPDFRTPAHITASATAAIQNGRTSYADNRGEPALRDAVSVKLARDNGLDYDPWMEKMLGAAKRPERQVIVVADLLRRKTGDNPHLWYDPTTMPAVAKALAEALAVSEPARRPDIERRRDAFLASLKPLEAKVAALRQAHAGVSVTATEPVFGYMASALGLDMRHRAFQFAVMNGTEPSARDVAALEKDIRSRAVTVLLYNSQKTDPSAERLLRLAREAKMPAVGVAELQPKGTTYVDWMTGQLDAFEKALAAKP